MAYTRKSSVFKVMFEEPHPFAGLTLCTRSLRIAEFAEFGITMEQLGKPLDGSGTGMFDGVSALTELLDSARAMFADALVSWDMIEEDGTPTPPTVEGVNLLEDMEFLNLVGEWLKAIGTPGDSLGKDSSSGETIPELSALMEPLSASQVS
jgi:hypothetical protein